jgi:NADH-quinone oxidoreductase subunit L
MLIPLAVLAIGAAVAGFIRLPHFVEPVFRLEGEAEHHAAWPPFVATGAAVLGVAVGWLLYMRDEAVRRRLAGMLAPWARVAENKYGFDLLFDWFARRAVVEGSERVLWRTVDAGVIDRTVVGTASAVDGASAAVRRWQSGLVRGYALLILGGAVSLLAYLLWMVR